MITLIGVLWCSDFKRAISAFSFLISSLKTYKFVESDSSFIKAFTLTILALLAKFNVERVYWKLNAKLDTVAIMMVLELPPSESLNKQVSLESL